MLQELLHGGDEAVAGLIDDDPGRARGAVDLDDPHLTEAPVDLAVPKGLPLWQPMELGRPPPVDRFHVHAVAGPRRDVEDPQLVHVELVARELVHLQVHSRAEAVLRTGLDHGHLQVIPRLRAPCNQVLRVRRPLRVTEGVARVALLAQLHGLSPVGRQEPHVVLPHLGAPLAIGRQAWLPAVPCWRRLRGTTALWRPSADALIGSEVTAPVVPIEGEADGAAVLGQVYDGEGQVGGVEGLARRGLERLGEAGMVEGRLDGARLGIDDQELPARGVVSPEPQPLAIVEPVGLH